MAKKIKPIRYSDTDLREFKSIIDKRLFHSKIVLKYLEQQLEKNPDDDEMIAQTAVQRYTITELEDALTRIQSRRFGVCENTRSLIDKKTLKLIPYVKTIEDAEILIGK